MCGEQKPHTYWEIKHANETGGYTLLYYEG